MKKLLAKIKSLKSQGYGRGRIAPVSWASGNVGSDNQIITAYGDGSINGESDLTYDGTVLKVRYDVSVVRDVEVGSRVIVGGLQNKHASALIQGKMDPTVSYQRYLQFRSEDASEYFTISSGGGAGSFFPIFSGKVQGEFPAMYFYGNAVNGPGTNAIVGFDGRVNDAAAAADDIVIGFYSGFGNTLAAIYGNSDLSIGGDLFVSGMDASVKDNVVYYDTTSKQLTYGAAPLGGGGNVAWASGNVGSNDYVITANGDGSIVAESNLTFDGANKLSIYGDYPYITFENTDDGRAGSIGDAQGLMSFGWNWVDYIAISGTSGGVLTTTGTPILTWRSKKVEITGDVSITGVS